MKWLSNRYAYPLVIFAIAVSFALQFAWLNQLFRAQRKQVKLDLEQMTGNAAKVSGYLSVVSGHEKSETFRNFFLSPEWLQFRQAYTNMRFHQIGSRFRDELRGDSTIVDISLRFFNGSSTRRHHAHATRFDDQETLAQIMLSDQHDIKRMDSLVQAQLSQEGIMLNAISVVRDYDSDSVISRVDSGVIKNAAFSSQQYIYNMKFLHTYQVIVPKIDWLVFYRMRYYLLSSCFMLLLTVAVFIFIFRLMRNQRLYSQARMAFTSNMTHELKTPVATVSLALETIMNNQLVNDPETLKNYLEISRDELSRLNLMIDKVLNLEPIDKGEMKLRKELFDVQQGISQVISTMRPQLENSGAQVHFEPMALPCFVSGDPVHLTNVFFNLIENSLKYGGEHVKLEITCFCSTHEVKISFSDSGPGIEHTYHRQIFERFFRVPSATTDIHNIKGTGLGLNYVKQTVEKHGGHIKLESEKGKGSNFIIYLPAVS